VAVPKNLLEEQTLLFRFSKAPGNTAPLALSTTDKMSTDPTARMAVLQLNKNLARQRLQLRTPGLVPRMHKCDPEIGTQISRNRRTIRGAKRIASVQLTQTRQFMREAECWHNLCSGHETTPLLPMVQSVPQA
jgi:hypothetical protein